MTLKNYKCISCGSNDFYFEENKNVENAIGLYCSYCGKFYKWLSKQEKRIILRQYVSHETLWNMDRSTE